MGAEPGDSARIESAPALASPTKEELAVAKAWQATRAGGAGSREGLVGGKPTMNTSTLCLAGSLGASRG